MTGADAKIVEWGSRREMNPKQYASDEAIPVYVEQVPGEWHYFVRYDSGDVVEVTHAEMTALVRATQEGQDGE